MSKVPSTSNDVKANYFVSSDNSKTRTPVMRVIGAKENGAGAKTDVLQEVVDEFIDEECKNDNETKKRPTMKYTPDQHDLVHIIGDKAHPEKVYAVVAHLLQSVKECAFVSAFLFTTNTDTKILAHYKDLFRSNLLVLSDVTILKYIMTLCAINQKDSEKHHRLLIVDATSIDSRPDEEQRKLRQFIVNARHALLNVIVIGEINAIGKQITDCANVSVLIPTANVEADFRCFSRYYVGKYIFPHFCGSHDGMSREKGCICIPGRCHACTNSIR